MKFDVDLFDVNINPQDVVITIYSIDDVVVQTIQLLQKVQFSADLHKIWIFSHSEPKQLFSSGICHVLTPQSIKTVLHRTKQANDIIRLDINLFDRAVSDLPSYGLVSIRGTTLPYGERGP